MTFEKELEQLLARHGWALPELALSVNVKPSTAQFWARGRSVPGKERLEMILGILDCDEATCVRMRKARDAHVKPEPADKKQSKGRNDPGSQFAKLFAETLGKRSISLYALADKAGVTRASMYVWINGKAVPSPGKLESLLSALGCDGKTSCKLIELCVKARQGTPRPRGYKKRAVWERQTIKRLALGVPPKSFDPKSVDSPYFDLLLSFSVQRSSNPRTVPLIVKRNTTDLPAIFVMACEAKRVTGLDKVLVLVPEIKKHEHEDLFAHHGIRLVTEAEFAEADSYYMAEWAKD